MSETAGETSSPGEVISPSVGFQKFVQASQGLTLSQALESFLRSRGGMSANTVTWYQARLEPLVEFLNDVNLDLVSVEDLRKWSEDLRERGSRYTSPDSRRPEVEGGLSTWTLHAHIRAAKTFFRWLVKEKRLEENPAARLELPKLPKTAKQGIKPSDMKLMLEAAQAEPRDYALVRFLADTACRVGGIAHLRLSDLDLEAGEAVVCEKGEKERVVYMGRATCAALVAWLAVRPNLPKCQSVFVGKRGGLTESGVYQVLKRLAKRAGVTLRWNPHQWRHGAARGLLKRGANLAQVSQILGHSNVSVTVTFYGTLEREELRSAHSKHSWLGDED